MGQRDWIQPLRGLSVLGGRVDRIPVAPRGRQGKESGYSWECGLSHWKKLGRGSWWSVPPKCLLGDSPTDGLEE